MSADTAVKRYSAMSIASPWRGLNVVPNALKPQGDRQAVMFMYSGILAGSLTPTTERPAGGWEYAKRGGYRRTEEELREARIRFGVLPIPAAIEPVRLAIAAQERAVASVDTQAKLSAAKAGLEAEDAFLRVYQAVYEDLLREDAAELFRMELAAVAAAHQAKRRKAALLLLLLN